MILFETPSLWDFTGGPYGDSGPRGCKVGELAHLCGWVSFSFFFTKDPVVPTNNTKIQVNIFAKQTKGCVAPVPLSRGDTAYHSGLDSYHCR